MQTKISRVEAIPTLIKDQVILLRGHLAENYLIIIPDREYDIEIFNTFSPFISKLSHIDY